MRDFIEKTYVCESCFNIQRQLRKIKCSECKSKMFYCDEWISPTIQLLNRKGYLTEYCCSGHYDSEYEIVCGTYIKFKDDCPSDTPKGFFISEEFGESDCLYWGMPHHDIVGKMVVMEYGDGKTYGQKLMVLAKALDVLHKWAESLPDLNKGR